MLAYTGLETVANLAAETREPGKTLPRSLFAGLGAVGRGLRLDRRSVGLSAYPARERRRPRSATDWLRAPLVGIVVALDAALPAGLVDVLRVVVGLTGAVVLARRRRRPRSPAPAGSPTRSARYDMLPHVVRAAEPADADRPGGDRRRGAASAACCS